MKKLADAPLPEVSALVFEGVVEGLSPLVPPFVAIEYVVEST